MSEQGNRVKVCLFAEKVGDVDKEVLQGFENYDLSILPFDLGKAFPPSDIFAAVAENIEDGKALAQALKEDPRTFLTPLLLISHNNSELFHGHSDEHVMLPASSSAVSEKVAKLVALYKKVDDLSSDLGDLGEEQLKDVIFLRYMAAREGTPLEPERKLISKLGYTYPILQSLHKCGFGEEIEILDNLEKLDVIKGKQVDKVHTCPYCGDYHINFREVCPGCRSLNIKEEATIHHFRCAYIGKESEFLADNKLVCPKCNKEIMHIGVDYDKPSENIWCQDCNTNWPEPVLDPLCMHCGEKFPPERVLTKQIKEYLLTQLGIRSAKDGIMPGDDFMDLLRKALGLYRFEVFEEFLKVEIARATRYKADSTLVRFKLKAVDPDVDGSFVFTREHKKDLIDIFKAVFRDTDIMTDLSETETLVILTHTSKEHSRRAMERLQEKINEVFSGKLVLTFILANLLESEDDHKALLEKIDAAFNQQKDKADD